MWKDSESDIDYIDFEYIAEWVNDIVLDDSLLPASIGIYGDWGSGKSSIMAISKKLLEEKEKNILLIDFNAWLFENYGDAKNTLINCILDKIEIKIKENQKILDKLKNLRNSINSGEMCNLLIKNASSIMFSMISKNDLWNGVKEASNDIFEYLKK